MKNIVIIIIFIFHTIFSYSQQTINGSIIHDGLQRDYILYIPAIYSSETAAPLIFNFHGYGSNSTEQMLYGNFMPIADTAGFLVVHPMGTEDVLGTTHWNVGWGSSEVDDVGFTSALIDSLALDYNLDFDKIYSTGMSNGGFMSYTLACDLSSRIAAIASVTGSMTINQPSSCNCDHPMPIMEIHGTADATVPYDGYYLFEPIEDVLNYWIDFNNCDTDPTVTEIPDTDPNDGCTAEHYLWSNGDNGVVVEHYKIIDGGHTWPGSDYDIGVTNHDMNASIEIWKFFSKYDINGMINPTFVQHLNENEPQISIYPNPSPSYVFVDNDFENPINYQIISPLGKVIQTGLIKSHHYKIDLSEYTGNYCFLRMKGQVYRLMIVE